MSQDIFIDKSLSKSNKYKQLIPQIESLISDESDCIANIGNIIAALKFTLDGFFWAGVYFKQKDELILGPFQGPVACTRIKIPQGVCGTAVKEKKTLIVNDVNKFPGHIACSSLSKSEIVVPVFNNLEIVAVVDIDSESYSNFDETDKIYLEKIAAIISQLLSNRL